MENFMYWSIIALWVFVLLQFIVIFMLTKLVAQFLNKLQIKVTSGSKRELQAGDKAPLFTYLGADGDSIEFPRRDTAPTLALFTAEGCPFCKKIIAELADMQERYPMIRIVVFTTVDEKELDIHHNDTVEYAHTKDAFTLYEIKEVPAVVLIDTEGMIAVKAAIASYKHLRKMVDEYFSGERSQTIAMQQKTLDTGNV